MKKNWLLSDLFSIGIIIYSCSIVSAQEAETDFSKEDELVKKISEIDTLKKLDDLKSKLDKSYKEHCRNINLNDVDLYVNAIAKIEASNSIIGKKPYSEEARKAFVSCSLLTEAAVLQIKERYNQSRIINLQSQINSVLSEIKSVREDISELEQSRASKLKADLDAEKLKAEKMRQEIENQFKELQSSLINVTKDARGIIISMSDILFEFDKANLTPDCKTNLAKIAGILIVFKAYKVVVEGHTDNKGSKEYNQKLSERRSENVMNFLIEQGVNKSRLTSVGYGETKPVATNKTDKGRQKNRRVDLIVKEKKSKKQK